MANWSGHPNGEIPLSLGTEFEHTGKYLQTDAARSLSALFDDVEKETGQRPYVAAGQDLYRDLAKQDADWRHNYHVVSYATALAYDGHNWAKNTGIDPSTGRAYITCAIPRYSNHGVMLAADISFNTVTQASFRKHCAAHNWTNAGDAFGESWHKEYHGATTTTASTSSTPITATPEAEEDDMAKLIIATVELVKGTGTRVVINRNDRTFYRVLPEQEGVIVAPGDVYVQPDVQASKVLQGFKEI